MSIDGNWRITADTPVGKQQVNLQLKADGTVLSGTVTDDHGTLNTEILDGSIRGDQLGFKIKFPRPFPMSLTFSATVGNDAMDGKVKLGIFGSYRASAVRA